ncbi:MAG TPA: CbiX/SirB N-terminal domain-containing protein [Polyangiaceae bacterium]|nr:CbiX/SirB N-terminal domain-containing protein [Polyangiaceae bacterium]
MSAPLSLPVLPAGAAERAAVVIVGHGSRDPAANAEFEAFVAAFAARTPDRDVSHGYLELAEPSLATTLARAGERAPHVVVLPLLLFGAGHVKNDLPLALAAARQKLPSVLFLAARPLGVHPLLTALLAERAESASPLTAAERAKTAVLAVGRGSSDPDANGDFCKLMRLFAEGRGFARVEPAFMGITEPKVDDALESLARGRPERILVVPALLFGGSLLTKLDAQLGRFSERYPWIKTVRAPHLGAHPNVFALMDERFHQAVGEGAPLPCDTCQYRTALPGFAEQVGGMRALLWSLRHSFTHTQAAPHVHAHRPLKKHVLVCGNVDCAERGSLALLDELRRLIKQAGIAVDVRVTRTGCMGRCGEGPTLVVYPDGVWYRGVDSADAASLVDDHLVGDRIVARLVDSIMQ